MTETASENPYESPASSGDAMPSGLTLLQASLLLLLAVVLILRGGFMLFSWSMQLSFGFELDSHFYAAVFIKDAIYGLSALIGGLMLLARHKIGWWSSLVHWCWYIACEIFVVGTGATLGWRVPVHAQPPTLYRVIGVSALLAFVGLSILLWRPIGDACNAPASRRHYVTLWTLLASTAVAFTINWWMSLR